MLIYLKIRGVYIGNHIEFMQVHEVLKPRILIEGVRMYPFGVGDFKPSSSGYIRSIRELSVVPFLVRCSGDKLEFQRGHAACSN